MSEPKTDPKEEAEVAADPLDGWITRNPDRSITLKLEYPQDIASKIYSELRLRRPKAKHMRGIKMTESDGVSGMDFGAALDLASRLADVSPAVIDELEYEDTHRLGEVVGLFFESSPSAG